MSSQTASGCTPGLPHFLETEHCGPGCSDSKAGTRRLPLGPAGFTGAHRLLPAGHPEAPLASCRTWRCGVAAQADLDPKAERSEGSCQRPQDWNLSSVLCHWSKLCAPRLPLGAQQVSRTSWRTSAVAQAVQILKQTPEGSCQCWIHQSSLTPPSRPPRSNNF